MPACVSGCFPCLELIFLNKQAPARPPEAPPDRARLVVGAPFCRWAFFAQRLAGEREAVMVLHQPIKHGIGDGLVANPFMPMLDRQLTGDDGGALTCRSSMYVERKSGGHISRKLRGFALLLKVAAPT